MNDQCNKSLIFLAQKIYPKKIDCWYGFNMGYSYICFICNNIICHANGFNNFDSCEDKKIVAHGLQHLKERNLLIFI